MKILYIAIASIFSLQVSAQGIRKNYLEMTDLEKANLVNAFYQLRLGPDLINNLASFHGAFFNFDGLANATQPDIHFNLPDEPEREIFFAWHRQANFELEQAMQDINPYITIPYWKSSTDQNLNSPLWDQNFLGQFNDDWNLNRNLGGNDQLPFPSEVNQAQNMTNFFEYSDYVERGSVHHGAHRWVGGVMSSTVSPGDPVFYFHHSFIDMLWQQWHDEGNVSQYMRTNMVRYDGTYSFNGQTLPSVNPNNIIDGRTYGTFYAENGLAFLDKYQVTNRFTNEEIFFYRYTIQAGNNFVVPTGRNARLESVSQIMLLPGFKAVDGSNFVATIGTGSSSQREFPSIVRNQIPLNFNFPIDWDAYNPDKTASFSGDSDLRAFPNPFFDQITIVSSEENEGWLVELFDLPGRKIQERTFSGSSNIVLDDLSDLKQGTYLLRVTINNKVVNSLPIIKK